MVKVSEEQIREELDNLVKKLPIEKLETARRFLKSLIKQQRHGQTWADALANPIYDDEPVTKEEELAVAEAKEDVKAGRVYTLEEVVKELGL